MLAIGLGSAWAQDSSISLGEMHNCTELKIPEFDETMTRQERVAILDALLNDVLSRTGGCETMTTHSVSVGSGSADEQLRGTSRTDALSTEETEGEASGQTLVGLESGQAGSDPDLQENLVVSEPQSAYQAIAPDPGKLPEDIPPSDSDDVIAKQLRKAAIAETDPEKQARLWNKYRQYMNLPTREASHEL